SASGSQPCCSLPQAVHSPAMSSSSCTYCSSEILRRRVFMLAPVDVFLVRLQHAFAVGLGSGSGVVEHLGVLGDVLADLLGQDLDAVEQRIGFVDVVLGAFDQGGDQLLGD